MLRFQLMMSCWSYEPSDRPSFSQCLDDLLKLHDRLQHAPFTVHNGHYVGTPAYRKSLKTFCLQRKNLWSRKLHVFDGWGRGRMMVVTNFLRIGILGLLSTPTNRWLRDSHALSSFVFGFCALVWYFSTLPSIAGGCDNIAYFQDENHNARTKGTTRFTVPTEKIVFLTALFPPLWLALASVSSIAFSDFWLHE